jgi:hypothetical protein
VEIFLNSISDLLINLAAGWLGAAFILPMTVKKFKVNFWLLLLNIGCGIFAFVVSLILRSS